MWGAGGEAGAASGARFPKSLQRRWRHCAGVVATACCLLECLRVRAVEPGVNEVSRRGMALGGSGPATGRVWVERGLFGFYNRR